MIYYYGSIFAGGRNEITQGMGVGWGGINHLQGATQAKFPTPVADSGGLVLKFATLSPACCAELDSFLLVQA